MDISSPLPSPVSPEKPRNKVAVVVIGLVIVVIVLAVIVVILSGSSDDNVVSDDQSLSEEEKAVILENLNNDSSPALSPTEKENILKSLEASDSESGGLCRKRKTANT